MKGKAHTVSHKQHQQKKPFVRLVENDLLDLVSLSCSLCVWSDGEKRGWGNPDHCCCCLPNQINLDSRKSRAFSPPTAQETCQTHGRKEWPQKSKYRHIHTSCSPLVLFKRQHCNSWMSDRMGEREKEEKTAPTPFHHQINSLDQKGVWVCENVCQHVLSHQFTLLCVCVSKADYWGSPFFFSHIFPA